MSRFNYRPCFPGCNGKVRYTEDDARRKAAFLQARDGDIMVAYPCRFGGYHVGHADPREAKRRRVINEELKATQKGTARSNMDSGLPVPLNGGKRKKTYGNRKREDYRRREERRECQEWDRRFREGFYEDD